MKFWRNCVNVIGDGGEGLLVEEYDNWLAARDNLARSLSVLSRVGIASWLEVIGPLDVRFSEATADWPAAR